MECKMSKYLLIVILLVITSCSQNNIDKLHSSGQKSQTSTSNAKNITGELDINAAFRMVFGSYNNVKNMSEWKANKEFLDKYDIEETPLAIDEDSLLYVKPLAIESFKENNIDKKIIITISSPYSDFEDCHACGVVIGGMLFSKANNEWKLDIDQRYITIDGEFGHINEEYELVKIGDMHYGILLYPAYSGSGFNYKNLILITQVNNELKKVLELDKSSNNEGEADGRTRKLYSYDSKYAFIPKQGSEYYDLVIVQRGKLSLKKKNSMVIKQR
ncbi:MAG: hypothetical protein HY819_12115 [Acidobacteria bacterium]|nr:hypothetical protein [Acidobacteriota bacterium]